MNQLHLHESIAFKCIGCNERSLGHITLCSIERRPNCTIDMKAGDGIRTHDVHLGKVTFYH